MSTNYKTWTEQIERAQRKLMAEGMYDPLFTYASLDRNPDKRLLLVCVETGRVLAACTNQGALDAATRLIGGK